MGINKLLFLFFLRFFLFHFRYRLFRLLRFFFRFRNGRYDLFGFGGLCLAQRKIVVAGSVGGLCLRREHHTQNAQNDRCKAGQQGKKTGKEPAVIVEEKGLKQESDTGAIEKLIEEISE